MRYRATLLVIILCSAATLAVAAGLPVGERPLTAGGIAYGIARDAAGNLIVTDWKMGEVWRVAPGTGAYARYGGLGNTLDAQPDGAGNLWLTAYWSPLLTRINTGANPVTKTTWDLTTWDAGRTYKLAGLACDDLGRAWFSEWGEISDTQLLYRFDPASQQLCGYTLPGGNHSWYVLYQDPYLWLGDWVQGLIVQFNTTNHAIVHWDIGNGAEPRGLAVDAAGNLWWADLAAGKLARLEPGANLLTTFTLPDAGQPNNARPYTVAAHEGRIWYAAQGDEAGAFGVLDPALAAGSATTARRRTFATTETCRPLSAGTTSAVSIATGAWPEPWPARTWTDITPAGATGWTVYEAPGAEAPYGIAIVASRVWISDQAYNKVVRAAIPLAAPTSTPTHTPTATPIPPTSTPTHTPTTTPVPPTSTPTHTPTATPIPPTSTPTHTPTATPVPPTSTPTHTPTVTPTPAPFYDQPATGDLPVAGTVSGSYSDTQADDGVAQTITEVLSGGKPASRYSLLEHRWTFSVASGYAVTFFAEAWAPASSDGDTFQFAYSTDNSTFVPLFTVTATSDGSYQQAALPAAISGTVTVRVVDTNRASGKTALDTIYVDHLFIRTDNQPRGPMHAGDLDGSSALNSTRWSSAVTITVHDASHAPLAGVSVTGSWSAGASGTASCTTAIATGACIVTSPKVKTSIASITFTVNDLALAGYTYRPDNNHDEDGDSTGTVITVSRP